MARAVVVTGATSFVGCHLARAFAAAGWRVTATHSRPLADYAGIAADRLDSLSGGVTLARLDLRQPRSVAALVGQTAPALWVHHAGHATDYASPGYDLAGSLAVNVMPLDPLFAALRGTGCGVIVTGSGMEYSASDAACREDDACVPDTPYGLSKLAESLRARQLALETEVPTRVARLFIPFGSLDNPAKLLSQVVARLRVGQPVDLSSGQQRRDFLGIADLCAGYLALADDLPRATFDIFNLCSGQAVALRELLIQVAREMGASQDLLHFGALPMRPGEPAVAYGSMGKAATMLGFCPRPLDEAIRTDLLGQARPGDA